MTDSYNQKNINLASQGGATAGGLLVYSPENPGPLAPNEFTDWAALVEELPNLGSGTKYVQIDGSFVSGPFPNFPRIPSSAGQPGGKWNMQQAIILGTPVPNTVSLIQFDDGAQLANIQGFELILVRTVSSLPVVTLGNGELEQGAIEFRNGALLVTGGGNTAPFIQAARPSPSGFLPNFVSFTGNVSGITDFGGPYTPLIGVLPGIAIQLQFVGEGPNSLDPGIGDWFDADPTSAVTFVLASATNSQLNFAAMTSFLAAPTMVYTDALETPYISQDLTLSPILPRIGYVVATAGAAATLQSPERACGPIVFKNSTGGPVTVSSASGTVNGGPSVVVPAGATQQFKSDNTPGGDWQTF